MDGVVDGVNDGPGYRKRAQADAEMDAGERH